MYRNTIALNKALREAAKANDAHQVIKLIKQGANVNAPDEDGNTSLHFAAQYGHTALVALLCNRGADVNAIDKWGYTPLFLAAVMKNTGAVKLLEVAEILLDKGADVNAKNQNGQLPLLRVAISGDTALAKLLLDRGAEVDAPDRYGNTPFYWAVKYGHIEVVKLLLERGANVNVLVQGDRTPLHYAMVENGDKVELIETLLSHGADINIPYNDTTVLQHFINYITDSDRANNPGALGWVLSSPQCISAILKSISEEKTAEVLDAILTKGGEGLVAIVADNGNPKTQKEILTRTLKQYAELLENPAVEDRKLQQLEGFYRTTISSAVQANPKLYDVAATYCNPLGDRAKKTPSDVVNLIYSYLPTTNETLPDGICLDTRDKLLEIVKEAIPSQEQKTTVTARDTATCWVESIANLRNKTGPSR